jgi:hypothetical protein
MVYVRCYHDLQTINVFIGVRVSLNFELWCTSYKIWLLVLGSMGLHLLGSCYRNTGCFRILGVPCLSNSKDIHTQLQRVADDIIKVKCCRLNIVTRHICHVRDAKTQRQRLQ